MVYVVVMYVDNVFNEFKWEHPISDDSLLRLFERRGVSQGYPYYANGDMLIRYHPEGRKWLVAGTEHKGNNCIAYAESQDTLHPGYAFLTLGFKERQRGRLFQEKIS